MVFRKPNFGPPPENYIAGLGRGASGFVTRADFGPSKVGVPTGTAQPGELPQGAPAQSGPGVAPQMRQAPTAAMRELTSKGGQRGQDKEQDFSDANFDEWSGFGGSLFTGGADDAEDKEADNLFQRVDEFMDGRRKKKREEKFKEQEKKLEKDKKDIQTQFSDLKRQLVNVSRIEWEALPDAPDLVKRTKRQKIDNFQRYTPVPDSVIDQARLDSQTNTFIDPNSGASTQLINQANAASTTGFSSIMNGGMQTSIGDVGMARGQLLNLKLASAESVISNVAKQSTSTFDRDGYMTALNSQQFNNLHDINDFKKARKMFKSVIQQNPQNSMGWIAAARIEHLDGKVQEARNIINQACHELPNDEDIWLEAAKLCPPEKVQALLAKAISNIPKSKKLWQMAALKEQEVEIKKQIYQRALEQLPTDLELWKESIQLASPDEAKTLLYRAVKCVPDSTDLWLALARLESYENARTVLNEAREAVPTDHTIWVNAAKLEEAQGNNSLVDKIINRAIKKLSKNVNLKRDQWLREAVQAEESGSLITCRAIIKETMHFGMEDITNTYQDEAEQNRQIRNIWKENAEECIRQGAYETARALYFNALREYPKKKSIWFSAIKLEEEYGSKENQDDLLRRAREETDTVFFYLKHAKFTWKNQRNAIKTAQILNEGYKRHPDSEDIVLALQKFYRENNQLKEAETLLQQATEQIPTSERVAMQAVQLQRELMNLQKALSLVDDALKQHRTIHKLWLIKAHILQDLGSQAAKQENEVQKVSYYEQSRKVYDEALTVEEVKTQRIIWLDYARFETEQEAFTRARTVLQKARIRMPNDDEIWLSSVRLEIKSDNLKIAQNLLSQALQKCPNSGRLWAQLIEMEPSATRKTQSFNAATKVGNDSDLFLAVAKVLWSEMKTEKMKKWIKNAIAINPDNGDAWALYYKYEMEFGNGETQKEVVDKFLEAEPRHGEMWAREVKKVENWRRDKVELLKKVSGEIKMFEQI